MSTLYVDNLQPNLGSRVSVPGHVIQVLSTTKTDFFSTTSTTFIDVTGLTLSITPSSTSSKILIMCKIVVGWDPTTTKVYGGLARGGTLLDGGTEAGRVSAGFEHYGTDQHHAFVGNLQYMDSPATTSATTYSAQIRTQGAGTVYCNRSHNPRTNAPEYDGTLSSTITLMEIAQ